MFEKVPGKYDLLKMDYSKGKDTPDSAALVKKAKERVSIKWTVLEFLSLICCWSIFIDLCQEASSVTCNYPFPDLLYYCI